MRPNIDQIPIEVIGNILSHLGEARDIVVASTTCRKWREAWRNHVHRLLFSYNCFNIDLTTNKLEILITETIFQTNGLRSLAIFRDDSFAWFSAVAVNTWLMHSRETLRELHLHIPTTWNFSELQKCEMLRLEVLSVIDCWWTGLEDSCQKFPCLKSLSLNRGRLSSLNLSLVLAACLTLEVLNLFMPYIEVSDANAGMRLSSSSLKSLFVDSISIDDGKFILEANNLEKLHLRKCTLELFALARKGSLKVLSMYRVEINLLDIREDIENLEVVDIRGCNIRRSKFYNRIKKSSNLKKLELWKSDFHDKIDVLDIGIIAECFPRLQYLSLNCDSVKYDFLLNDQEEYSICLENMIVLKLKGTVEGDLPSLLGVLLKKCPNLKELVIHGVVSDTMSSLDDLGKFNLSIIQLMRRYTQVQISLVFKGW